ncbi:unnamed protein product [Chondrus crispus]|uniref:Secreted protein n=1 Tax=Chondrus crispus TaxID=2769 RepID=R7QMV1_CHOCR|nr:unnamed protein product [Chondrus crispus]CDF38811.1 unnamed protein product [Chondrus crispus]|eukprot:XP_005718716.1 unnamed protein product [Chondrus crispus]
MQALAHLTILSHIWSPAAVIVENASIRGGRTIPRVLGIYGAGWSNSWFRVCPAPCRIPASGSLRAVLSALFLKVYSRICCNFAKDPFNMRFTRIARRKFSPLAHF